MSIPTEKHQLHQDVFRGAAFGEKLHWGKSLLGNHCPSSLKESQYFSLNQSEYVYFSILRIMRVTQVYLRRALLLNLGF